MINCGCWIQSICSRCIQHHLLCRESLIWFWSLIFAVHCIELYTREVGRLNWVLKFFGLSYTDSGSKTSADGFEDNNMYLLWIKIQVGETRQLEKELLALRRKCEQVNKEKDTSMFSKRIAMAEVANWCLSWENVFVICRATHYWTRWHLENAVQVFPTGLRYPMCAVISWLQFMGSLLRSVLFVRSWSHYVGSSSGRIRYFL